MEYKEDLKAYINKGKFALFTGNAFEMLGKSIKSFLGEYEGLGVFNYEVIEQSKTRNTADAIVSFAELETELVGFINKCSVINGIETPLFSVKRGLANNETDTGEGVVSSNFYGTHLTGPVLVKNPHFLKYIASKLVGKTLNDDAFYYEKKGFEITLTNLKG